MNRLFFDHGEALILETIKSGLCKDDLVIVNTLEFVSQSLLQYQKQTWRILLNKELKSDLQAFSEDGNYFVRVKSVEILYQLAGQESEDLEAYYLWLQNQFKLHYEKGDDPLLLYTIFYKLNTKYGGTWVFDYEVEMITKLLEHTSPAMQFIGLACFKSMNPDRDEVPESLWELIDTMEQKFPFDFFECRLAFENKLKQEDQINYPLLVLETFIVTQK